MVGKMYVYDVAPCLRAILSLSFPAVDLYHVSILWKVNPNGEWLECHRVTADIDYQSALLAYKNIGGKVGRKYEIK